MELQDLKGLGPTRLAALARNEYLLIARSFIHFAHLLSRRHTVGALCHSLRGDGGERCAQGCA